MDKKKYPGKRLSVMFSLLTLITLTLTLLFTGAFAWLLIRAGLLVEQNRSIMFFIIAVVSVLVGTVISHFAGKRPLSAIIAMSTATQEVAKGNFSITLDENIEIKELRDMAHNFNRMAKELAGTEMLRTDFVENVSHEFKTPLSAICAAPKVTEFAVTGKGGGVPNDVVMNVVLVDVGADDKGIIAFEKAHGKFIADAVGFLRRDLSGLK